MEVKQKKMNNAASALVEGLGEALSRAGGIHWILREGKKKNGGDGGKRAQWVGGCIVLTRKETKWKCQRGKVRKIRKVK